MTMAGRWIVALMFLVSVLPFTAAEAVEPDRVEPPFWWTGMNDSRVQLMVYGEDIAKSRPSVDYPGVSLERIIAVENPNYLFIDLKIGEKARPGTLDIRFQREDRSHTWSYELRERRDNRMRHRGFDPSDVIYLIMPDRFANGDPSISEIEGMYEGVDRSEPFARHGGDIQGIIDNLDYIRDLGMTALWLNPILENDMPYDYSQQIGFYHGYAATDKYRVDRRFGTNEKFVEMVDRAHEMGLKVIMDMIHNHIGTHHWWMKDLPTSDWIHDQEEVGNTSFRTNTIMDPYASRNDYETTVKGWFVDEMPDLNQRNELLANYLIQNTIWWIEYAGIDGIRMDTHPYPYKDYMAEWTRKVLEEYPDFNIVGEAWMPNVPTTAWWQYDFPTQSGYNSYLPSVTDFPLYNAIVAGLNEEEGWDTGMNRIYLTLGQDFLYTDPLLNVIFVDNHDLDRFFSSIGEDYDKFRLGVTLIYTTRGIPQIYYGTEILKTGAGPDALKRKDFPGGWPDDPINAFTSEGRAELGEKRGLPVSDAYDLIKTLSWWRQDKPVLHYGDLTHFVPEENTYVYFRHNDDDAVMVVLNASDEQAVLDLSRFSEVLDGYPAAHEIITDTPVTLDGILEVPAMTPMVLDLMSGK
ncbi:glycoside hydrolase family 13 protein [Balneolales bacterium ANBcel1]|nr:glycoside hydrolase family 13 protein [Balneolales bacterium ANBcel1]